MRQVSLHCSGSSADRRARAARWLADHAAGEPLVVVAASLEAASDLLREMASERGAGFGWHRFSPARLAAALAAPLLAEEGLSPASGLPLEALCARVIHELASRGELGELAPVADKPGLARALARTFQELRLAGLGADRLSPGLGAAIARLDAELQGRKLVDRAGVLRFAARAVLDGSRVSELVGVPLLLLDVPVATVLERELIAALAGRSGDVLATVPAGDDRSLRQLRRALGEPDEATAPRADKEISRAQSRPARSLERVQRQLFAEQPEAGVRGDDVRIVSAPGEGRECVEIARQLLREAEGKDGQPGVPFDRMAVLLRAPQQYRGQLEEALARAGIPACFARGTSRPDPSGRAFLALLSCAAQGLSASRFAEYLSLGEVPDATPSGQPPAATPAADRFVAADDELVAPSLSPAPDAEPVDPLAAAEATDSDPDAPVRAGLLRAPWRWEKLLALAAVIGGKDGSERWRRRIDGLAAELSNRLRDLEADEEARAEKLRRDLSDLAALKAFALPLVETLAALPAEASWGEWLDRLTALASRGLRRPERVLSLLAELQPLAPVGPVGLVEVRLALQRRLSELLVAPPLRRYGRVFVAPVEAARGLCFDVVFVPGLAEKIFPPKLQQDPLLRDEQRARLSPELETQEARLSAERLALRLAVGAARERVHLSYPRLDAQGARPRVPSFYALEVVRAAEGRLPGFGELMRSAEQATQARIGWPAPRAPRDAIDDAEHDLALLDEVLRLPDAEARGTARYLLSVNPHLARSLRARARRFRKKWLPTDGLVDPGQDALAALAPHQLAARSYSATALQNFAACPYRFLLQAVHRLAPREQPEAIDEIDPLSRGSLMHEVQFELLSLLQRDGLLPLDADRLPAAQERLERVLAEVARKWEDALFPAIDRVFRDGVATLGADLRRWLELVKAEARFEPFHFELAFGLSEREHRDAGSVRAAVTIAGGLQLRGSIDLVERTEGSLSLRATDYKSGKQRAKAGVVIDGGKVLQPIFYALALEQLFPGAKVEGGRLFYCTQAGNFETVDVPLDQAARGSAALVVSTVGEALRTGFFPAAPNDRECEWCDYQPVCGPLAATAAARKPPERLGPLVQLRREP